VQTLYCGQRDAMRHDLNFRWRVFAGVAPFSGMVN
jgi:hypothetical protein